MQVIFSNASTRLNEERLQTSLPYPALPQAVHDGSELAVLEVVGHDDVGPSCIISLAFSFSCGLRHQPSGEPPTSRARAIAAVIDPGPELQ